MCGILLGTAPHAVMLNEQGWAQQCAHPWDMHMVHHCPLGDPTWTTVASQFPTAELAAFGLDVTIPQWKTATVLVETWWASTRSWWEASADWQAWWQQLGQIPYGRIAINPVTGAGWVQYRPRTELFPRRLHPVGTVQWGQITAPEQRLAIPAAIVEFGVPPIDPCICCVGEAPETVYVQSVWFAVLNAMVRVFQAARQAGQWLVIEIDGDYNEVLE